jgi:hypothetical protein
MSHGAKQMALLLLTVCKLSSSPLGYSFAIRASKFGSGLSDRLETNFFRQVGHSLLPLLRAVIIQSWQNLCKHSFVVIVFFNTSKQIGHISSLRSMRGVIIISESSVISCWGCRCSS